MRVALLAVLALAVSATALEVPFLSGRVVDHAGLLGAKSKTKIETASREFEGRTGRQLAVLILPSLKGEPLEEFSLKVARTWALGRKGKNDGILLLVSRDDRKLRIETGHGAEGDLTDAQAGRIISRTIVPLLRKGDFEGGIEAGVLAMIDAVEGRMMPEEDEGVSAVEFFLYQLLVTAIFVAFFWLFEYIALFTPYVGWIVYLWMAPFWYASMQLVWGEPIGKGIFLSRMMGFLVVKFLLFNTERGRKIVKRQYGTKGTSGRSGSRSPDWSSSGGGSSSGGSSSGSSFSGGGGSFGGGGASGSW